MNISYSYKNRIKRNSNIESKASLIKESKLILQKCLVNEESEEFSNYKNYIPLQLRKKLIEQISQKSLEDEFLDSKIMQTIKRKTRFR